MRFATVINNSTNNHAVVIAMQPAVGASPHPILLVWPDQRVTALAEGINARAVQDVAEFCAQYGVIEFPQRFPPLVTDT